MRRGRVPIETDEAEAAKPATEEVDGIEYVTGPPRTQESDQKNQDAARNALAELAGIELAYKERKPQRLEIEPLSEERAEELKPKLWRVLEQASIPRGGSLAILRVGKIVSANEYDVPALIAQGVKLAPHPG